MKVIFGLGNPGKKFEKTRHNLGFLVIDFFAKEKKFPKFKFSKKFLSLISEKKIGKEKIILVKPQTFMNLSGIAAKKIVKDKKIKTENLILVHDEIDLPFGKMKIVKNRGSAGHKGVQSVIDQLKTKNFVRLRIGISKRTKKKIKKEKFVLENFEKKEGKKLKKIIEKAARAIDFLLKEGIEKAMTKFNK